MLLIVAGVAAVILTVWAVSEEWTKDRADRINYSELINLAREGMLRSTPPAPLILVSNRLRGSYFDETSQSERRFQVIIPHGSEVALADALVAQGWILKVEDRENIPWVYLALMYGLPLLILTGVLMVLWGSTPPSCDLAAAWRYA